MSVYLLTCNITENTCSLQHYRKHVQDYTKHLQHYRKHVQHYMKHVQRYKKHLQHYTEHLQHYRKHVQHYKCQMKQKQCTNSVPIVKNSQTAKMSCLHRVRRIHKVRVRVRRPRPPNTQSPTEFGVRSADRPAALFDVSWATQKTFSLEAERLMMTWYRRVYIPSVDGHTDCCVLEKDVHKSHFNISL